MSHIKNLKQTIKAVVCCTILNFNLITKRGKYLWMGAIFSWQTATLQTQHVPTIVFDEEANDPNSQNTSHLQNLK